MSSASGRTVVVFNGEIYNSRELAARLCPDFRFRTTCDTEVFVEAFERHGVDVFSQLNGMFAAALFDVASHRLTLVRDRMGKKPLYFYAENGFLAFASELRALKPFGLRPDPRQMATFFHLGYFPAPHTFYKDTMQVRPGEFLHVLDGRVSTRHQFHSFADQQWATGLDPDAQPLDELLSEAVRIRTISDVPVGAFLSGGVDSALVATHLSKHDADLPTFTIGFPDKSRNESTEAARTAKFLGLPHQTINVDEMNLPELAHDFVDCYEQPYADTSGLVTMLLCRAVKQQVTVALSGDGGDEFFAGYSRYNWFRQALIAGRLPAFLRGGMRQLAPVIDRRRGPRLSRWLATSDAAGLYAEIIRNWTAGDINDLLDESEEDDATQLVRDVFQQVDADPLSQAACFDATYYIPDDLQVKIDRASMNVALEVRCPLLDFRVANYGMLLSTSTKLEGGLKSVLKHELARHLPNDHVQRRKHGFSVPLSRWLQGPLRSLVHETLHDQTFRECGWLNQRVVQRLWRELFEGRAEWAHCIWMLFSVASCMTNSNTTTYPSLDSPGRRSAA